MGNFLDLKGEKFGELSVISKVSNSCGRTAWLCLCDCGTAKIILSNSLKQCRTRSCGCLFLSLTSGSNNPKYKHGLSHAKTRLYRIWCGMRRRCNYVKGPDYEYYGGRGITVSSEWDEFLDFRKWALGNGYQDNLTIDRVDNNGNYEPSNCEWKTRKEQSNNCRRKMITYKNENKTIKEWSMITGIPRARLNERLRKGYSMDDVFYEGSFMTGRND